MIVKALSRLFYNVAIYIAVLVSLVLWSIRGLRKTQGYGWHYRSRFGLGFNSQQHHGLLIHCVSVGEVAAASHLVKRLQHTHPELPITITTTTVTGAAQVARTFGDTVKHYFLPLDSSIMMRVMLNKLQPAQLLITEVELWPNLIRQCHKKQIPVSVINARMTNSSAARYAKLPHLIQPMLAQLKWVCAQSQQDADNYLSLGIAPEKVHLTHNMKFDQAIPNRDELATNLEFLGIDQRIILLGASTHEGEEKALLDAYNQLKPQFPDLLLMLVPRHPQRFSRALNLALSERLNIISYSSKQPIDKDTDAVLIDVMGKLNACYAVAKIAFVGGSLVPKGGHNALEAAALGVPILMGPEQFNNPQICQALQRAGALFEVRSAHDISNQCEVWLADEALRKSCGAKGLEVLQENAGAVVRTLNVLGLTSRN